MRFLEDPNIPIDNNRTEGCLRVVVVGRKNHYGSRSQRGTEVAALFYCGSRPIVNSGIGRDPQSNPKAATSRASSTS